MSETVKTLIYVLLAAVALLVAWAAKPATIKYETLDDQGDRFFEQFDPLAAKSLEIVSFDEASARPRAFKVAQVGGRWAIPSHEDYPADAQDHLAQAASSVMDLVKGAAVSDSAADHDLFGVADPVAAGAGGGAGTRVTMQDESGKTLVNLIIGKEVKDAQQMRYVRIAGKDRVYSTKVNTHQLTTKFEDWIERDLLKLQTFLISQIVIDDYSIDEINGRIIQNERVAVNWDSTANKWSIDDLVEGETVKTEKLDELRNALRDLRIIDVHRKPAGLSSQLQDNANIQLDSAAVSSLMSRGYYIVQNGLKSNQGETIVRTSEGVEYTLRFGEVVTVEGSPDLNDPSSDSAGATQTGRYVFVTAHFNPSLIPAPALEPVPDPPAPATAPATQPAGAEVAPPASTQPEDPARAAIIQANAKKTEDHNKKIADGQEKVKDLNRRFADWYYVVSDAVYQKIRLCRADVVAKPGEALTTPDPEQPQPMPPGMPGMPPE